MAFIKKILVRILTIEACIILRKYKPFIIAVTGSVGKTSTKDAIYSVIKNHYKFARKSEKSMNSDIGLPLTILGVPNAWKDIMGWYKNILHGLELIIWRGEYPDCLVLEVGADHPGDIQSVTKWLRPDIAIITKVGDTPVHVEFFDSPEDVFREKSFLASAVKKGGSVVLFADEPRVMTLESKLKANSINVITFGIAESATIRATDYEVLYNDRGNAPIGFRCNMSMNNIEYPITIIGVLSESYIYSLMAAMAVGKELAIDAEKIITGLNEYKAPPGRMNIIKGIKDITIIDDTYNSSPDAVGSAIKAIKSLNTNSRKIVILGDMMELGKHTTEEHKKIGKMVANVANILITVGPRSQTSTIPEARLTGMDENVTHSFDSSIQVGEYLKSIIQSGDIILVKGSQSMRMERIVKAIMSEPEKAVDILVRQEKEWLEKK